MHVVCVIVHTCRYDTPQGPVEVKAKQVVSTVPAWVAADLFRKQSVSTHVSAQPNHCHLAAGGCARRVVATGVWQLVTPPLISQATAQDPTTV